MTVLEFQSDLFEDKTCIKCMGSREDGGSKHYCATCLIPIVAQINKLRQAKRERKGCTDCAQLGRLKPWCDRCTARWKEGMSRLREAKAPAESPQPKKDCP